MLKLKVIAQGSGDRGRQNLYYLPDTTPTKCWLIATPKYRKPCTYSTDCCCGVLWCRRRL